MFYNNNNTHACMNTSFPILQEKYIYWRLTQNFVLEKSRKCNSKFCEDFPNCVIEMIIYVLFFFPIKNHYAIVCKSGLQAGKCCSNKKEVLNDKVHGYLWSIFYIVWIILFL